MRIYATVFSRHRGATRRLSGNNTRKSNPWYAVVTYYEDGKRKTTQRVLRSPELLDEDGKPLSPRNGKPIADRLAREWLKQLKQEQRQTELGLPEQPKTVSEWVAGFILSKEAVGREASTISSYSRRSNYIDAVIGNVKIEDVGLMEVEALRDSMLRDGKQAYTINDTLTLLLASLRYAYNRGAISDAKYRSISSVSKISIKPRKPNYLESGERDKLKIDLDSWLEVSLRNTPASDVKGKHVKPTIATKLALYTGMRIGEICGLQWKSLDFNEKTIEVNTAVGRSNGTTYIKEPKSANSIRTISLPEQLSDDLEQWKSAVKHACSEVDIQFTGDLFVFGEIDGSYYNSRVLSRNFRRRATRLELIGSQGKVPTFHDLRHTYATTAIAAGYDIASVAALLGDKTETILNYYVSNDRETTTRASKGIADAI